MKQIQDCCPDNASKFHREIYEKGIESVLYTRCMKHFEYPQLNHEEGDGECPICAIEKLKEVHSREIRNMALDAYDQAFKAIMESVKTAGFCSFCGIVISVHNTMAEAQGAMRAHIVACPKMHEELGKLGVELALQPSALHVKCAKCGHPNFNHTKVNGCTEYIQEQCAECGCLEYAGDTAPTTEQLEAKFQRRRGGTRFA